MRTEKEIRLHVNLNFCIPEPIQACRYPYPDGYWGRFLTGSMTNEDHDYINEMLNSYDRISAQSFDENHTRNKRDMETYKKKWEHELSSSAKFDTIEIHRMSRRVQNNETD